MPKHMLKGLSIILGVLFFYGCAATKDVEVRRYIEVRDRVDQDMEGNAGFLAGTPQPEDRSEFRKTRKIYVLEVSKDAGTADTVEDAQEGAAGRGDAGMEEFVPEAQDLPGISRKSTATSSVAVIPTGGEDVKGTVEPHPSSFVEYKVQKDDTLQKISKKFYDSYSQWRRIYEANRDVIDNPDRIKPGIVIQIPMK